MNAIRFGQAQRPAPTGLSLEIEINLLSKYYYSCVGVDTVLSRRQAQVDPKHSHLQNDSLVITHDLLNGDGEMTAGFHSWCPHQGRRTSDRSVNLFPVPYFAQEIR